MNRLTMLGIKLHTVQYLHKFCDALLTTSQLTNIFILTTSFLIRIVSTVILAVTFPTS